jgi:hypothetical protein
MDCGTQSRAYISESAVTEYAELMASGVRFPPLDVFHDGTEYYPAHGFHRTRAAIRAGLKEFACTVHKGTLQDAIWFSIGANIENGERRSAADKHHAVELALTKFPDKTQEQIAEHVGCVRSYVAGIQKELVTADKLRLPATRKGKDAKSRPTQYRKRAPKAAGGLTPEERSIRLNECEARIAAALATTEPTEESYDCVTKESPTSQAISDCEAVINEVEAEKVLATMSDEERWGVVDACDRVAAAAEKVSKVFAWWKTAKEAK